MKKISFLSLYLCLSAAQPYGHFPPGLRKYNTPSGNPAFPSSLDENEYEIEQGEEEKNWVQATQIQKSDKKGNKVWKKFRESDEYVENKQRTSLPSEYYSTNYIQSEDEGITLGGLDTNRIQIDSGIKQPTLNPSSNSYIYHNHPENTENLGDNIVYGQPNFIQNGHSNYIQGKYNQIHSGDFNQILGTQNRIYNGDDNYVRGKGNLIVGSSNKVDSF